MNRELPCERYAGSGKVTGSAERSLERKQGNKETENLTNGAAVVSGYVIGYNGSR